MHIDAPSKEIQDSLGFWIPPSGYRIPGTGIVNGILNSLMCIPDSVFQIFLDKANIAKYPLNTLYYDTVTRHRLREYHDRWVVYCPSPNQVTGDFLQIEFRTKQNRSCM